LDHDSVYQDQVIEKYGFKEGLPVIPFNEIVTEFTLPNYLFLDGGSLITDLLLLRSLAKATKHCEYFEIGTWRGESCSNVADYTSKCFTFNLPDEDMVALGHDSTYLKQLELLSKSNPKITAVKGNSLTFDFSTLDIQPNLIFIDGDHHAEAVKSDSQKIFDWIDKDSATIVWHDYGNSPEKIRWSVLKGVLDGLPIDEHQYLYHVENTKCAIYTRKPFTKTKLDWPSTPKLNFNPTINPIKLK
ncbi:MAG: class I SAM-dependent methyltransferase, partial [Flavobacteriales bacterium]|nr:class I SAM-dependent methyltransferase [Flavobacteriales bacterium]